MPSFELPAGFEDSEAFLPEQSETAAPDKFALPAGFEGSEVFLPEGRTGGLLQAPKELPENLSRAWETFKKPGGGQRLWEAVKEVGKGMVEPLTVPGQVAAGKLDPTTPKGADE